MGERLTALPSKWEPHVSKWLAVILRGKAREGSRGSIGG